MEYPFESHDRQLVFFKEFDRRIRLSLRKLVSDAVIEEHRRKPLGQHSDALERLLNYFRRGSMAGKLALYRADSRDQCFGLVRLSGRREVPSERVPDIAFTSVNEAYHAVFLSRIEALMTD